MKVAFILSGLSDGLQCLDRNREKVASVLKKYGWCTRVETTFYSQASLMTIINEYKNKKIEDFIFFYTGHGDTSSDEGILTLKLHDGTTIDINTLHREYLSKLNIKRKAIILDACYSGNFEGRRFHDQTEYLCSCDFDEEGYEDNAESGLKSSYFSYYFCEAIETLSGEITLDLINNEYLKPKIGVQNSKYISIDSKMIIADKVLDGIKKDTLSEYQPIIVYINEKNITVTTLLDKAKNYLDLKKYNILSEHKSIENLIPHLEDLGVLYCVIKDIFQNDNQEVSQWIEQDKQSCEEVQAFGEPRVVIIFTSKNDAKKYDVTFISANLPNTSNENYTYDLADGESKNKFIEKMMSYIKFNPIVDLVLPAKLMSEDINLWKVKVNQTLSRLSKLNIRHNIRYFYENDIREFILQEWETIVEKIRNGNLLLPVDNEEDMDNVGSNMPNCGIYANLVLNKEDFEFLLGSEMGYIMLWLTQECTEDLEELASDMNELQKKYYALNNKPINLMYDDPNTYYYPSKGEER